MRKIPKDLIIPFRNWLLDEGFRGVCAGQTCLKAWKPKHKTIVIDLLVMNRPCIEMFIQFLNEYLACGKVFLVIYRDEFEIPTTQLKVA